MQEYHCYKQIRLGFILYRPKAKEKGVLCKILTTIKYIYVKSESTEQVNFTFFTLF